MHTAIHCIFTTFESYRLKHASISLSLLASQLFYRYIYYVVTFARSVNMPQTPPYVHTQRGKRLSCTNEFSVKSYLLLSSFSFWLEKGWLAVVLVLYDRKKKKKKRRQKPIWGSLLPPLSSHTYTQYNALFFPPFLRMS